MKGDAFLIAASRTHDYDWVIVPEIIPILEKGNILSQLPTKVAPELRIVEFTCGNKKLWAALRTERTTGSDGKELLDEAGRPLRHTFGAIFPVQVEIDVAASEVRRLTPAIKEELKKFLWTPSANVSQARPFYQRMPMVVPLLAALLGVVGGGLLEEPRVRQLQQIAQDTQAKLEQKEIEVKQKEQIARDLQIKYEQMEKLIRELQTKLESR